MEHTHLDREALIRAAYGVVGEADAAHLTACPDCAAAAEEMVRRRSEFAAKTAIEELPETFWQRQEQAILYAAARPAPRPFRRAAAGLALAALVLLALWTMQPTAPRAPEPRPSQDIADQQLLRDVRILVQQSEPRALAPLTLLFSDRAKEEFRP